MNSNEAKARAAIAEQAGEWFVANDEGLLDARQSAELAAWFRASPAHVEEFLGVAAVARHLKLARDDPQYSLVAILERARAADAGTVRPFWPRAVQGDDGLRPQRGWLPAAAIAAACVLLGVGLLFTWHPQPAVKPVAADGITALHLATRHGEQLTRRLPDDSVLHLNTDSAASVHFSTSERLVVLNSGQATFEVAHEAHRLFHVQAGSADVTDLGTRFDVRLDKAATIVTVVEGRVAVGRTTAVSGDVRTIEVNADQQLRVAADLWPARPVAIDAKRTTAWQSGKLIFDNERLERVAEEFNRYSAKPIEIATPALRKLRISGVFATDDTDAFVAFLRSLKGVRVEVSATRILVSQDPGSAR